MADTGAHAVIARIAAAHDHHVFPPGGGVRSVGQAGIQQAAGGLLEEVHREADPTGLPSGYIQIPGIRGAAAEHHCVKLLQKLLGLPVPPHVHAAAERHALLPHQCDPAQDDGFLQLHVGDAVHQQTAGAVLPLKDGDAVAPQAQLVGAGQAGGAGAHHRHPLSGAGSAWPGTDQAALPGVLDDPQLVFFDRDRLSMQSAGAGRLAQGGADPSGEFRKIVGF